MPRPKFANLIRKLTGRHVFKHLPKGVNLTSDLVRLLPRFNANTIIDVGANIGNTVLDFHKAFPSARIYAFEPVPDTYALLAENTKNVPNVECIKLALSSVQRSAKMSVGQAKDRARIFVGNGDDQTDQLIDVNSTTLDNFMNRQALDFIDILKIDTEGHELSVLSGAHGLLDDHRINVILVESSVSLQNNTHSNISEFSEFFLNYSYLPFAIYDQVHEWPTNEPFLRRCNCAYISERINGMRVSSTNEPGLETAVT